MRRIKHLKIIFGFVFTGLIVIQFVPVQKTNPPVTGEIQAPAPVMQILRKACYDCHSNETKWPWYSNIAPISWLVVNDVMEGREEMNFSVWNDFSNNRKYIRQTQCGKLVAQGEMPLWFYVPLHTEASLSQEEIETIVAWAKETE